MRWNSSTKAYAAVLVIAAGGLLVDRLFLGTGFSTPKQASAALESIPALLPKEVPNPAASRRIETAASRLSQALGIDRSPEIEDAFTTQATWLSPTPIASKSETQAEASSKPFDQRHALTGFSASRGGNRAASCVWLDKVKVEIGTAIDGMTLISINAQRREATFEGPRGQVVLTLQRASASENGGVKPTTADQSGEE
ncbi:hypothetical protein D4Q85_00020 [bacterium]|nr:MAG: hypothetical protein D4Q85_00020 [bacterium]